MEYLDLKKMVDDNLSIRKISMITNKSHSSIRYWLKKYNLLTNHKSFKDKIHVKKIYENNVKYCPCCKIFKDISTFYKKRIDDLNTYCKVCENQKTIDRMRIFKIKCVEYKGGCCNLCGYDKYIGALEFHHINSETKEYNISRSRFYTFDDKIKKELDKCELLCSNCHKEVHFQIFSQKLM